MPKPKTHLSSFLLLITTTIFSFFPAPSSPSPGASFVYGGCSEIKFENESPFESNLDSLLTSILNSATFSLYNNFTISSPEPHPTLYGLYQCRGDISTADCAACVKDAVSQLPHYCFHSCGGTLQLDACHVRYSNESFLGVPDTTLVLKKCGAGSGLSDTDMLSRRDELLSGLGSGNGGFRVGNIGYVSGMAQCVGDLSGEECTDCLSNAVERLRGGCGAGSWGDVYLSKCYVRYSAGGVYLSSSGSPERFWERWWVLGAVSFVVSLLKWP
ncbi:Gnk2 domain-containing protein [Cinnamomum micranthum f. kanehirae]|uniref:Gnk2 domain-containing protein n=1 Tax=Cinnamomum micranthum f. kanehirae TaxID=337451 RepID=A0A443N978_9MAGN|nr:Gnk2 domain-containing protein [Cinnamomum micranthum f. kanehirae]